METTTTTTILRGNYGQVMEIDARWTADPSGLATPAPATYHNARSILAKAIRQGLLDAPYCDVDRKHRGSALNYDLYDFARGVALVQRRETRCTKYGNSPRKEYLLLHRTAGKVTVSDAPQKARIARLAKSGLPWGGVIAAITGRRPAKALANTEGGDQYYKAVAVVDGRYLSIYDGETEYRLSETTPQQTARRGHNGGWYVYASGAEAYAADVPARSALLGAPRAILRVRAEGAYCRYDNGKLSFSRITPLEAIPVETYWPTCGTCGTRTRATVNYYHECATCDGRRSMATVG